MISKGCPKCKAQVAVACKSCPCGHIFFTARNRGRNYDNLIVAAAGTSSAEIQTGQRRTERVKREKPKFYDSLQFENKLKKRRKAKVPTQQPVYEDKDEEEDEDSDPKFKKRRKLKKHDDEEDPMASLSSDKISQCAIELSELNRKIFSVSWRV